MLRPSRQPRKLAWVFVWAISLAVAAVLVVKPHIFHVSAGYGPLAALVALWTSVLASELSEPSSATERWVKAYAAITLGALGFALGLVRPGPFGEPIWRSVVICGLLGALVGYSIAHAIQPIVVRLRRGKGV